MHVAGRGLAITGRQRELLAALLLRPNAIVSGGELVEDVWPDSHAAGLGHRLHTCVGRLRKSLAPDAAERIVTREPGYLLLVEPGELDAERFDALCAECGDAACCQDWRRVLDASDAALSLWRGEPLLDIAVLPGRGDAASYYNEQLLHVLEHRMDALIGLRRYAEAAAYLDKLVRRHPLRERFTAQRMTALSLDGRRAEALLVYRSARRSLVDTLGIEPGVDVKLLHQLILEGSLTASSVS